MKTVRVQKSKLIEILTKNREEHRGVFVEAQENYRKKVIEVLDDQLKRAREKQEVNMNIIVQVTEPQDHTGDYDRVLQMLEMSVDDVIELQALEFQNFVQDYWGWSQSWAISNMGYSDNPKVKSFSQGR